MRRLLDVGTCTTAYAAAYGEEKRVWLSFRAFIYGDAGCCGHGSLALRYCLCLRDVVIRMKSGRLRKGIGIKMDFNFGNGGMSPKPPRFGQVRGTIVDMVAAGFGTRRINGCVQIASLENEDGDPVNVILSPNTYVVDFETLSVGMQCTFWYLADAPMLLIYPPQYSAAVAARDRNDRMVDVSYYGREMVNQEETLKLKLDASVDVRTTNNQYFQGSPADHDLVVIYETSTRSIPAQTTPKEIVVLCGT